MELFQLLNEDGMIEFKYHHFAISNEIMCLSGDHQWLLI